MTDRTEWVVLVDPSDDEVGLVSPTVALLLIERGIADGLFTNGPKWLRLRDTPSTEKGRLTATVPSAAPWERTKVIKKKFTGASADVEIEYLNADDKVCLDRALVGTNRDVFPKNASDRLFKSLDEWLMAVYEAKQAGHRLACLSAPKERVAVVLDYDTDTTYSLPFRHLYATAHDVQPSTVHAWGFTDDPLELLRQVRDHHLRETLVAGNPDSLMEGVLDAQPDAELEALWKEDAEEVLAAFNAHTESLKASARKDEGYTAKVVLYNGEVVEYVRPPRSPTSR